MTSRSFSRSLSLTTALSLAIFLSGCGTDRAARLAQAEREKASAALVEDVIDAAEEERARARQLPPMPDDCSRWERSGVSEGERLDAALLRTDAALGRANARARRCAAWYDEYRKALANAE